MQISSYIARATMCKQQCMNKVAKFWFLSWIFLLYVRIFACFKICYALGWAVTASMPAYLWNKERKERQALTFLHLTFVSIRRSISPKFLYLRGSCVLRRKPELSAPFALQFYTLLIDVVELVHSICQKYWRELLTICNNHQKFSLEFLPASVQNEERFLTTRATRNSANEQSTKPTKANEKHATSQSETRIAKRTSEGENAASTHATTTQHACNRLLHTVVNIIIFVYCIFSDYCSASSCLSIAYSSTIAARTTQHRIKRSTVTILLNRWTTLPFFQSCKNLLPTHFL